MNFQERKRIADLLDSIDPNVAELLKPILADRGYVEPTLRERLDSATEWLNEPPFSCETSCESAK